MSIEGRPKMAGTSQENQMMGFEQFYKDPQHKEALEEAALEYLKTEDREYFEREFSGELDSDGYLLKKDGSSSNTRPSMNIGGGKAMQSVIEKTKEKLRNHS